MSFGFAEFARAAGNLLSNPLKDAIWRAGAQEIAADFLKFGEALDRGAELLSSGTLTGEERKITARVIDLCRGSSTPAADVARRQGGRGESSSVARRARDPIHLGARDSFDPVGEYTIEYEEDTTKHIEHDDGTIETVVVRPRGTSERLDLSRVEWHLKALLPPA